MNRREMLQAVVGAAIASKSLVMPAAARGRWVGGRLDRLGLQLYTVRGEMAKDVERTLARVAEIGYAEVEFAGYFDRRPAELRAMLDRAGLAAPSAHLPYDLLRQGWGEALDAAHTMGHRYLVVAWIPEPERRTLDSYRAVAELMNRAGEAARAAGFQYAYHNHDFEFAPLDGRVPYDVLLEYTDPTLVRLELDLFWITKGGQDPLRYFERHAGRFPLVHVKDMDAGRGMVDVGQGIIDFRRILAAAPRGGVEHFFVEHDEPASPFDSVRASFQYLKRLEL